MIEHSVRYLASDEALRSIRANAYWPKWDSPWWHMTLLHELGEAARIPEAAVRAMVARLAASPVKVFPIRDGDAPPGTDFALGTHCHCALGNIYQALAARGVAVDDELPWIRPWFLRYVTPDGGLNCDNESYSHDPVPSSMVGTIAPLEAVLRHTPRPFTAEEERFLDRGAACLLGRGLMRAGSNPRNAEEREDEADWLLPAFPRFYFYDVLRGLSFVLEWAERRKARVEWAAIADVAGHLERGAPDGRVRIGRRAFEGIGTLHHSPDGKRLPGRHPASLFPLLEDVSRVGEVSHALWRQWTEARERLAALKARGQVA